MQVSYLIALETLGSNHPFQICPPEVCSEGFDYRTAASSSTPKISELSFILYRRNGVNGFKGCTVKDLLLVIVDDQDDDGNSSL